MQTRIYRFEIVRAIVNGVYEARDTDNNSSVTLYEWTPAIPDRAAAKLRRAEVQDQLQGAVFTADASLYLIAPSPAAAREPLETLHSRNLFTGIEANGPQPSPQPQAPQPARTDPSDGTVWTGENYKDAYPVPRGTFVYFPIRGPRPSGTITKLIMCPRAFPAAIQDLSASETPQRRSECPMSRF